MTQQDYQTLLNNFITKYTGIQCGDTSQNFGQCVGLSELWMDTLNLNTPHEYGNACDLLANANDNFDVIYNTPTGIPLSGDIMVWGTSWGSGYGHTGIFCSGNENTFNCFEQNDAEGSAPHAKIYNYNGIIGWLHPKITFDTPPTPEPVVVVTPPQTPPTPPTVPSTPIVVTPPPVQIPPVIIPNPVVKLSLWQQFLNFLKLWMSNKK